jgi:aminotransferase EvaB
MTAPGVQPSAVPAWSYLSEYEDEREDILDAVDTVFRSGRLILGESVRAFEEEFAAHQGFRYCVGVDNGTNALSLAMQALGVGPGDEVVTVANTAPATAVAIAGVGAVPVFVDVRQDDLLMDTERLAEVITPRTRALLPVHLYGWCANMPSVLRVAADFGLAVVEDCAQAHGASLHGVPAGGFGDAGAFSFYPTKILGAYGDAGAVVTGDRAVRDFVTSARHYGMGEGGTRVRGLPARNSRLDEVQAEILRRKLRKLDAAILWRRRTARYYGEALSDTGLRLPAESPQGEHVPYVYAVRHPRRDEIVDALRERGVQVGVHYPYPIHTMDGFSHLGYSTGDLPVTESACREVFSLPVHPALGEVGRQRVVEAVREILGLL